MKITITGRHVTIPENFKEKLEEKISRLEKYNENINSAKIIVTYEKKLNIVEVTLSGKGIQIIAKEKAEDPNDALNGVIDKLEVTLKKEREKIKSKKNLSKKNVSRSSSSHKNKNHKKNMNVVEVDGKIIEINDNDLIKPISLSEAIIILDSNNYSFFAFNDIYTDKVSVVYKKGTKYALIQM